MGAISSQNRCVRHSVLVGSTRQTNKQQPCRTTNLHIGLLAYWDHYADPNHAYMFKTFH